MHVNNGTIPTNGKIQAMFAAKHPKDTFGTFFTLMEADAVANMKAHRPARQYCACCPTPVSAI